MSADPGKGELREGQDPEQVLERHRRRAYRQVAERGVVVGLVGAVVVGVLFALGGDFADLALIVTLAALAFGLLDLSRLWYRQRIGGCRALIDLGHFDAAIAELKPLRSVSAVADEAAYLVGLAYDRKDDPSLALESYRRYLREHADGDWTVEAQARIDALAPPAAPRPRTGLIPTIMNALGVPVGDPTPPPQPAPTRPAPDVARDDVSAAARAPGKDVVCPFCRDLVETEALAAECADCGTPHHLCCYEEQGGCSVYGCRSRKARARVRE